MARELVPGTAAGVRRAALDPIDRELWRVLDGPAGVEADDELRDPTGFWSRLAIVESAPRSQFDALAAAMLEGLVLPGPVAALAGTSERFRGFHDRTWTSSAGNLHLSVVVPLPHLHAMHSAAVSVLPAVATLDAVVAASGGSVRPQIKWVNDLYLGPGKVAGVLARSHVQGSAIELAVFGIGVNVACAPAIQPTPFVPAAAHLPDVAFGDLLHALLAALGRRCEELQGGGIASLLTAYRTASSVVGRRVRIYRDGFDDQQPPEQWPPPITAGVVMEVRDDLSLILEGMDKPVTNGRLAFEEDCLALGLAPV
jgi:biotin-(acetyl-CoA carboxylase) ligase